MLTKETMLLIIGERQILGKVSYYGTKKPNSVYGDTACDGIGFIIACL